MHLENPKMEGVKTIWKQGFGPTGIVTFPEQAEFLSVGTHGSLAFVWALVNPALPVCAYQLEIFGTGHPVPMEMRAKRFLGTFNIGELYFHVFAPYLLTSEG